MKRKVLFFDDIFSELFREQLSSEHLAFDDNWVAAVCKALDDQSDEIGTSFEVVKHGDIDTWRECIEKEHPDILLLDCYWPEEAFVKYKDRSRGSDISLDILRMIREAFHDLLVVCYTVRPDKDLMEKAYDAGATFFLEKTPFAIPEVQSHLRYIMIYLLRQREAQMRV